MNKKKIFIFRFNLNKDWGSGHFFRALNLSKLISKKNIEIVFLTLKTELLNKFILNFPETKKYIKYINKTNEIKILKKYSSQYEIKTFISDIKNTNYKYMLSIKKLNYKIVSFDDLGKGSELSDYLIDANIISKSKNKKHLYGPKYIFLNPIFSEFNQKPKLINKKIDNIFVFLGGTDSNNHTKKIIKILLEHYPNINISTVCNELSLKSKNLKIYKKLKSNEFAKKLFDADLAIINGGITMFECFCTGTPPIIIAQNKDEKINADNYKDLLSSYFPKKNIMKKKILNLLNEYDSISYRFKISRHLKKIVDGLGYKRILKIIK